MTHHISLFGAIVAAQLLLAIPAAADNGQPAPGRSIVGAWQVTMTVRQDAADCSTAQPVPFGPNPFPALYTFHEGGTVSETGSRSPPSQRSPGHGVWQRVRNRSFGAHVEFQVFDANGFLSNFMDIRTAISLSRDGNAFAATGRLLFSDVSGNAVPFCHTQEGVRITP
jgi:hypothetical protein